jgi:hypothetical protein
MCEGLLGLFPFGWNYLASGLRPGHIERSNDDRDLIPLPLAGQPNYLARPFLSAESTCRKKAE